MNSVGQIGDAIAPGISVQSRLPLRFSTADDVVQVSAGYIHTCILLSTGKVLCAGSTLYGQIGNGSCSSSITGVATPVEAFGVSDAISIGTGVSASCAVLAGGGVKCWGYNGHGQMGNGTVASPSDCTTAQKIPGSVVGVTDATQVVVGYYFACARGASGAVYCWGSNEYGQLGDGSLLGGKRGLASPVVGLTNVVDLSAGENHVCAVKGDGTVYCWGRNNVGQLGTGYRLDASVPQQVLGITDAVQVAAGSSHTCALRAGGEVLCWGDNSYGQLGTGTRESWTTPTPVVSVFHAIQIAASNHTCAVVHPGRVVCWGHNHAGQLGDGTNTDVNEPVKVLWLPE